jgi:hypothetical protein
VESDISAEYPGGEDVQEMRNSERGVLEVEEEEWRSLLVGGISSLAWSLFGNSFFL